MSYNYNYGQFSTFMYADPLPLLKNPELLTNSWLGKNQHIASLLSIKIGPFYFLIAPEWVILKIEEKKDKKSKIKKKL